VIQHQVARTRVRVELIRRASGTPVSDEIE
jgi:hypothetical protein